VVAHEVAHLAHMDHGTKFKALERKLFEGDVDAPRLLLRRIGSRLKRIGRTR
jgi:predicted metal-dependent hydrolase